MTSPRRPLSNLPTRPGFAPALGAAVALLVALGLPGSAHAALVYVTFDGPFLEEPDPRNFGIGAASIAAALDASVPLVRLDPMQVAPALAPGPIAIEQTLLSHSAAAAPPVDALSEWTGESSVSFADSDFFLIFAAVEPAVPEASGPYSGPEVQIGIDADLGWVLTQIGSLVYPAVRLQDLAAEQAFVFDVVYLIDRALPLALDDMGQQAFFLPQFRLVGTDSSAVIPEPATALLLGLGMLGFAVRRRHLR